jgi:universal stress protein E
VSRRATYTSAAAWDYPPYEAILRRAVAIGTDLIVAPRRDRHHSPSLLGYTDWELLRLSPVPVLLVKTSTPYRRPTALAAIDPTHAHVKPSALDQRILDYGAKASRALRGALHVVHAYVPQPPPPTVTFDTKRRRDWIAANERESRRAFGDGLQKTTVPASRRHLMRGEPTWLDGCRFVA